MLSSMYSAISGMQSFQTQLDVIGNNIANVNTVGFKAGRVDFSDVLSQTKSGGNAATAAQGGTNPQQVGLGTQVGDIQTLFTQGAPQATGSPTDLTINGGGLFVVSPDGNTMYYTRAGDFTLDSNNNLVLPDGSIAMGYSVSDSPSPAAPASPINLDNLVSAYNTANPAATVTLDANPDVQIGSDGSVTATVTDNTTNASERMTLGHLALASFPNPAGLEKVGDSLFSPSANSGGVTYQTPGSGSAGSLQSGYLEMSNVDLTQEFTNMIVAQNAFTANSKMIGTDNTILNDIVNMKNS